MSKIQRVVDVIEDVRAVTDSLIPVLEKLVKLSESLDALVEALTKSETKAEKLLSDKCGEQERVTFDTLSNTLMSIARKSKVHSVKLRELVRKYGATKLSEIEPEHYEAILAEAEVIGDAD